MHKKFVAKVILALVFGALLTLVGMATGAFSVVLIVVVIFMVLDWAITNA